MGCGLDKENPGGELGRIGRRNQSGFFPFVLLRVRMTGCIGRQATASAKCGGSSLRSE
jgi:hypothetical protein